MSSIVKRSGKWIFLGVVFIVLAPSVSAEGVRRDLTEKVASGEIHEARASWWGFDSANATKCLQSALDSGAKRIVVDRQTLKRGTRFCATAAVNQIMRYCPKISLTAGLSTVRQGFLMKTTSPTKSSRMAASPRTRPFLVQLNLKSSGIST